MGWITRYRATFAFFGLSLGFFPAGCVEPGPEPDDPVAPQLADEGEEHPADDDDDAADAADADADADPSVIHRHHADVTEIVTRWRDVPASMARAESLVLVVESHATVPIAVDLGLNLSGLDDRQAELSLPSLVLAPGEHQEVEVAVRDLPLQSASHSITIAGVASFERDNDQQEATVQTQPLALHYDDSYDHAYVYSHHTMVTEHHGGLPEDPFDFRGRIAVDGGFATIESPAAYGEPGPLEPVGVGSVEYTGDTRDAAALDATADGAELALSTGPSAAPLGPGLLCIVQPWNCCTGDNCQDVCADWTATYLDSSAFNSPAAEDYGIGGASQSIDASFAEYAVTKTTCYGSFCVPKTVGSGRLGPDGCAKVNLTTGTHTLRVTTSMRDGTIGHSYPVHYFPDNDTDAGVGTVTLSKTFQAFPPNAQVGPPLVQLPLHEVANAAAAVSRMLASGILTDQGSGFTTQAGLGCHSNNAAIPDTDACVPSSTIVRTGPYTNPNGIAGDLRWKFVLAHELGHAIMRQASGVPYARYCFSASGAPGPCDALHPLADPPAAPVECRCDQVTDANQLHCLQSIEESSAAQSEGFAHFVSARLWNDPSPDCRFNYYKQVREPGGVVVQPPYAVSCADIVQWQDTYCPATGGGTEYDWLQFFWWLHAADAPAINWTMHDFFTVYAGACSNGDCTEELVTWAELQASAANVLGAQSAKYVKFIWAGLMTSVDD